MVSSPSYALYELRLEISLFMPTQMAKRDRLQHMHIGNALIGGLGEICECLYNTIMLNCSVVINAASILITDCSRTGNLFNKGTCDKWLYMQ